MKKLMWFVMLATGCVAGYNEGTPPADPPPDVCDVHAADWAGSDCAVVESSAAYGPDTRFVCPQADGSEWGLRMVHDQYGKIVAEEYEHYIPIGPVGTPGAHLPDKLLCLVTLDGRVIVRPQ